ncbi:MAG: hypothetical protein WCR38_01570 [Bacteroidales bacterium]|jgi:hypothetical protein
MPCACPIIITTINKSGHAQGMPLRTSKNKGYNEKYKGHIQKYDGHK